MTERIIATERDETDFCEKGTQGCCINHTAEDERAFQTQGRGRVPEGSCETW